MVSCTIGNSPLYEFGHHSTGEFCFNLEDDNLGGGLVPVYSKKGLSQCGLRPGDLAEEAPISSLQWSSGTGVKLC
jgi:hypothetical protein